MSIEDTLRLAIALDKQNQWPKARAMLMDLVRQNTQRYDVLVTFGRPLLRHRQLAAAQTVLERAVQIFPEDSLARLYLAHVLLSQGRWVEAQGAYRAVLQMKPQNPLAELGIALAQQQLGNVSGAAQHRLRAFARQPWLKMATAEGMCGQPRIP